MDVHRSIGIAAAPVSPPTTQRRSRSERFDTWVSGYPNAAAQRLLHQAPVALWRLGLGRLVGRSWMLLTTTGRTSGEPRRTPLTAHRLRGRLFAWNPYGERAHWYRNLLADPIVTIQSSEGAWTAKAVRLDDEAELTELYEVLRRFDGRGLRRYLADQGIADSAVDVVANMERLHVIRFEPTSQPGPQPLKADLSWVWLLPAALALARRIVLRMVTQKQGHAARVDRAG